MPIIDVVKWDGTPEILAWKFPATDLSTYTQLIVNESQDAFLASTGVYEGPFPAGRHTLSTENLPVLRGLMKLPFGGLTPFTAEVWYVNKTTNLDVKWGTPDPVQVQDPKFGLMIPVRAFGQYGVRIADSKRFLLKMVGTLPSFDAKILTEYFRGIFVTRIKTLIATAIVKRGVSILEITTELDDLSAVLEDALKNEVIEYGVEISKFRVLSINVDESDPAVARLKEALARKAEMSIVGFSYQQERSFDVLQSAAGNEGTSGGVMGAGIGAGLGLGIGANIGQMLGSTMAQQPGMIQPGMIQPGMMQPGMMQPGMMQPGMMQPGMQQPGMMQPGMQQPGMMQPGMMQPGMQQPGMMQPGMMQPGMMQPGMQQPGMMQPGMMQPGMMQPGMMQPGMMQPGIQQPDVIQSAMPQGAPGLGNGQRIELLRELATLRDQGILSEEEFAREKARILSS